MSGEAVFFYPYAHFGDISTHKVKRHAACCSSVLILIFIALEGGLNYRD
jgi:hypothetical protein